MMSRSRIVAPADWREARREDAERAVAITFSPRERSSSANASPRPEEVPVISQVRGGMLVGVGVGVSIGAKFTGDGNREPMVEKVCLIKVLIYKLLSAQLAL